MATAGARGSSAGWAASTLLGMAGWIGVTVYVAATNEDPSDATPILRTFALAGGAFLAVVLAAAAVQMRRRSGHVNRDLYLRLAVQEVPPGTVRAAARRTQGIGPVYLLLAAATTGLVLGAIGLGEDGPTAALLYGAVGLVLVWLVVMVIGVGRAFRATDDLLAPLGLAITSLPTWVPHVHGGGGSLAGRLGFSGERHGREVSIAHRPRSALTSIRGRYAKRTLASAGPMADLTGEPARFYRDVEASAGPDGIEVRRAGNGAGRHLYHDLLLAERLADSMSPPRR